MNKDTLFIIGIISVVAIVFSGVVYGIYWTQSYIDASFDKTYIVVEDEIIDTATILNDDGSLDYITIFFSNGESYDVTPRMFELDLTVNSRLIIEMYRYNNDGYFDTDVWHVSKVVKVPNVGEIE